MKRIRVGHIGTMHDHSEGKIRCIKKYPDIFEIVGVVPENQRQYERIKDISEYSGCKFMTEEELFKTRCDCILVEGHEYTLPYVAKRCVERGIPVHIDKPAGKSLDTFQKVLEIAERNRIPVQMGYMYRYNPAVRECIDYVKGGKLGEVYSISAIMNTGHSIEKRKWMKQFDSGIMYFLGCHMIDLVLQIQGIPQRITPYIRSSGIGGVDVPDQGTVVFEYKNGLSIIQANACEINGFSRRQLVVCGSKGTYEIRPLERPTQAIYTNISDADTFYDRHIQREFLPEKDFEKDRYDDMMLDFAAMVRGEKENPYSYEYELQLQKTILTSCG